MKATLHCCLFTFMLLLISCGAAPEETPAEREFSLDPASIETTPLPTPTALPTPTEPAVTVIEESYPVAAEIIVTEAYPAENSVTPNEAAYPVEDEVMAGNPVGNSADADVTFVRVVATTVDTYTFHVTVAHPDTGWDDYTDGWDVVLPDGTVVKANSGDLFTRLLLHPHETEQPFTRNQSNIVIPNGITQVTVRAHDIVAGFGGAEVVVDLKVAEGVNFTVEK